MKAGVPPLVSIVTPVHNGVEFLAECIESVLAQTYPHWEYTIVDNCSTDGSAQLARQYAALDPRIRVCENRTFLRAIANHNAALRQISASSKYCKVVFADDWIFPECLEKMVAVGEEHPSAGLIGAYSLEGQHVTCAGLPYSSRMVSGRDICRWHFLNGLYLFGSANTVLYRADLVRDRDPFYNEANIHADTEVCFALLKLSDFGFVHQVLTYTRVRPDSLTAISADLNTDYAGTLQIVLRYGPDYLTGEEFEACLRQRTSDYYRFLGKSLFLGRDRKFWSYHKGQLAGARLGFSRARLAKATLAHVLSAALSPKHALGRLRKHDARRTPVLVRPQRQED